MGDLRERVPGHSLIEELLRQWDAGVIRLEGDDVVIDEEAISWYDGVKGERIVAKRLATLGPGWTVLHSVPVGTGSTDIDHVVIGPAGVFTINTKNSSGRKVWVAGHGLLIDGFRHPEYIRNAVAEWHRAESALSRAAGFAVPVTSLIVFVDPWSITKKAEPGDGIADVQVISDRELEALPNLRRMMSDEQLARVVAAAVRPEVWHRNPQPWPAGDKIAWEFDALDDAVGSRIARVGQRPERVDDAPPPTDHVARGAGPVRRAPRQQRRPVTTSPRPRSRRKRATPLEKLFSSVAGPIAVLVIMWIYLSNLGQR